MIPIGPGDRKLLPVVTYVLIALNVLVFAATLGRVQDDHRRIEEAAEELEHVQFQVWIETHRKTSFEQVVGLESVGDSSEAEEHEFWLRFEVGRIVPTTDLLWQRWDKARRKFEDARHSGLFYEYGVRRGDLRAVSLFTAAFLHAGFMHLAGNMLFLWVVGTNIEEAWGRRTFVVLYVLGIVMSSLAVFFDSPITGDIPGVGASGAIACVMGAFAVRCWRHPIRMLLLPTLGVAMVPAWVFTGLWFAQQLYAFGKPGHDGSGVAFGVHVLGFVVGAGMALALKFAGSEEEIEAPQRQQIAQVEHDQFLREAEKRFSLKDSRAGLELLGQALQSLPDDHAVRERKMLTHGTLGEWELARAEGMELLERLWRGGDKRAFAEAFKRVDQLARPPVPVGLVYRAAQAFEPIDPSQAGQLYVRIARDAATDPILPAALRRYALLLEKVGEPEKAAQVRAVIAAADARKSASR